MSRFLIVSFLLAAALLAPAGLAGQATPRTDVFEIEPPIPPWIIDEDEWWVDWTHAEAGALAVPEGFVVYWSTSGNDSREVDDYVSMNGQFLDSDGRLGDSFEADMNWWYCWAYSPVLARSAATGNLIFAWVEEDEFEGSRIWYERFDSSGLSMGTEIRAVGQEDWEDYEEEPAVAVGREIFVIAWRSSGTTQKVQVFRATDGEALTPPLSLDNFSGFRFSGAGGPAVGIDAKDRFVVIWPVLIEAAAPQYRYFLRGQRFNRNGQPLGQRFTVAEEISGSPALVMEPDGSFTVAWSGRTDRIRQFQPDGTPAGPPVEVPGLPWRPVLARDPHGNMALAGSSGVQLFNRHLVPQGPPLDAWADGVALDGSGRLLTVWTGPLAPDALDSILGRIWDVRRDADACIYRGKRFLCDTAGDGGAPDVAIPFGRGRKVDTPLLGDFDGDGRDDPCVYGDGRFLCDTAHNGDLAEKQSPRFGQRGDVPLFGDLDGDGRDDPCVYRAGRFLCDADRNGKADRSIAFGLPGDRPVIGDVDGDRRDEACMARDDRFLCDTAHDGGSAEMELILGALGTPALGDVDGDGRDDPCVFTEGRLVCGLFPEEGGLPTSIVDRAFGKPGDLFVLGDLDAF